MIVLTLTASCACSRRTDDSRLPDSDTDRIQQIRRTR
jgi:hypothetical protein